MTEDEFVKVCRYERDEYRKKKKQRRASQNRGMMTL